MSEEKKYSHETVVELMDYHRKQIKELKEFKDDIKQMVENYISSNTSDENVYRLLERLCINHMLEQNDKYEQEQRIKKS